MTQVQTKPDVPSLDSINEFDTYWPRRWVSCDESKSPSTPRRRNLKDELHSGQLFFVHTAPEKFKTTTEYRRPFWICVWENSLKEISWRYRFWKARFLKCFPSTWKQKAGVFKLLQSEEHFRKAPFLSRMGVDGRGRTVGIKLWWARIGGGRAFELPLFRSLPPPLPALASCSCLSMLSLFKE